MPREVFSCRVHRGPKEWWNQDRELSGHREQRLSEQLRKKGREERHGWRGAQGRPNEVLHQRSRDG